VPDGEPCAPDDDAAPLPDAGTEVDAYVPQGCWLPCKTPNVGTNTACGRIVDGQTNQTVMAENASGTLCDEIPLADRTGPCRLDVTFYDALDFTQNPTGAAPLQVGELLLNDCGHFMARDIPTPALGYLAVAIDDDNETSADDHVLSSTCFAVAPSELVAGLQVLAVTHATDQAWTATARDPFGVTKFSEKGVAFLLYHHRGEPVPGVQPTRDPTGVMPSDTFYFSDIYPDSRTTVDPAREATGADGSALVINSPLVDHAGVGGLSDDCVWKPTLAKSVPGAVMGIQFDSVHQNGGEICE